MKRHVLLIHGAGAGAYEEDKKLAASLTKALGTDYEVHYPAMVDEEQPSYAPWAQQIEQELATMQEPIILVGHSFGASVIIKWISEAEARTSIVGAFLTAAPFWGGNGWRYEGYEEIALPEGPAAKRSKGLSLFFYHCRDDATVPFDHLALYAQAFPQAKIRELDAGGHQLNSDVSDVAKDIKALHA
jgi:uncharacterized protein